MKFWYEILGIDESATLKEIKTAYRQQLRKYRPEDDSELFQELREAYEYAVYLLENSSIKDEKNEKLKIESIEINKNISNEEINNKKSRLEFELNQVYKNSLRNFINKSTFDVKMTEHELQIFNQFLYECNPLEVIDFLKLITFEKDQQENFLYKIYNTPYNCYLKMIVVDKCMKCANDFKEFDLMTFAYNCMERIKRNKLDINYVIKGLTEFGDSYTVGLKFIDFDNYLSISKIEKYTRFKKYINPTNLYFFKDLDMAKLYLIDDELERLSIIECYVRTYVGQYNSEIIDLYFKLGKKYDSYFIKTYEAISNGEIQEAITLIKQYPYYTEIIDFTTKLILQNDKSLLRSLFEPLLDNVSNFEYPYTFWKLLKYKVLDSHFKFKKEEITLLHRFLMKEISKNDLNIMETYWEKLFTKNTMTKYSKRLINRILYLAYPEGFKHTMKTTRNPIPTFSLSYYFIRLFSETKISMFPGCNKYKYHRLLEKPILYIIIVFMSLYAFLAFFVSFIIMASIMVSVLVYLAIVTKGLFLLFLIGVYLVYLIVKRSNSFIDYRKSRGMR